VLNSKQTFIASEKVHIGGHEGGSCWNDDKPVYRSTGNQVSFDQAFDKVIEAVAPSITYLQVRKVLANANVQIHEETESEWYGNDSEYKTAYANAYDLYNAFIMAGVFEGE
jgi:hypothetical protein